MSLSSSSSMICFNSECTGVKSERPRRGWRLRSGEYAELCDRCGFAFEEGRFCESFHLTAAGWRCCESCGKRVHCGCIVSAHGFVLLDAGGIECISCATKNRIQSTVWRPASMFLPVPLPERPKDLSVRNWSPIGGSGPIGPWQQPPNLFSASAPQSESLPRIPYDVEIPGGAERCMVGEKLSASLEKKKMDDSYERLMNGNLKLGASETPKNGHAGINYKEQPNYHSNNPQLPSFSKINSSNPHNVLAVPSISTNGTSGQINGSGTPSQKQPTSLPQGKQIQGILHNGVESSNDRQARNGKSRGRNHLLTRYLPKSTDQELQKIYGVSNSVITPLFEKMLSASDAGKIGRLVLPKKCAEAYLPRISQPEGLPLKVQDSKGQEWIFQFRFWPNNNSRMYVLEGITPCIQSMQLQAGDTVTFSRLEPEGKLVMGFRKASNSSSDQGNQIVETGNGGASTHLDITNLSSINQVKFLDPASTWSQIDKSGYIAQEVLESKPSLPRKRKNSTLGSKSKRLRIEHEEMIELKLTWEEAQGLLRPPFNHVPAVVVIEGFEFEEYEDAPILGRPTIFAADNVGVQWVQCDNCLKWRRIPHNALLPSKWCCSENLWDPERSNCSAAQELATEQLASMLPASNPDPSKKTAAAKRESDTFEAFEGLDALANLAILGEGDNPSPSSQATTTKHPRHRPGCSCIVCIQPPSGKGPKHKQTCTCNVCSTVKRRFRTLMLNREKKLSEKEAEFARTKQEQDSLSEKVCDDDSTSTICNAGSSNLEPKNVGIEGFDDDPNQIKSSTSLFKGKIDLNIQPEREDEPSPTSDPSSVAA